jgi:hypothetical protein
LRVLEILPGLVALLPQQLLSVVVVDQALQGPLVHNSKINLLHLGVIDLLTLLLERPLSLVSAVSTFGINLYFIFAEEGYTRLALETLDELDW